MSNPPIQAQWSLSQTAGSAVTMSMGMLSALHSDNVQPLAYLACEKFGATLAISPDTTRKIEAVVVPPTAPAAIAFLQAQVGFFKDDCATQFGTSQAGVRFLALAAALTTTLPIFHAAQAVEIMLKATTSDLRMLPSTRHLKNLLESLGPRCHRAGFANDVLGWKMLFHRIIVPSLKSRRGNQDIEQILAHRESLLLDNGPSAEEMVDRLIDAFRQIGRVGESTVSRVTVRLCCAVPWVMAFTKWSLGAPPRIHFDSPDEEILPSNSPVTLLVPKYVEDIDDSKEVEVAIYHAIGHPRQLLAPPSKEFWMGMVPVESYGKLVLQKFNFETDFARRMLNEALGCAVPKCLELLRLSTFIPEKNKTSPWSHLYHTMDIDLSVAHNCPSPLPHAQEVAATCARLFGLPRPPSYEMSSTSRQVGDYPLVKDYLAMQESRCPCTDCMSLRGYPGDSDCVCELDEFYHRLSMVVVVVLALSLFSPVPEDPEPLLLSVAALTSNSADWLPIASTIQTLLIADQARALNITHLLKLARVLAGHDGNTSVMSSEKGQVLFHSLFATQRIVKDGCVALSYLSGVLKYDNITYRVADTIPESQLGTGSVEMSSVDIPPVVAPQNLFTDLETCWEVRKVNDDRLGCTLKVRSKSGASSYGYLGPMDVVFGLMNGLFLEACPHDSRAALDQPDEFANYCGIFDEDDADGETPEPGSRVNIVAVDGAEDLRMAAIFFFDRAVSAILRTTKWCLLGLLPQALQEGWDTALDFIKSYELPRQIIRLGLSFLSSVYCVDTCSNLHQETRQVPLNRDRFQVLRFPCSKSVVLIPDVMV